MRYDATGASSLPKRAFHPADPYYAFVWTLERSLPAGLHLRLARTRRRLQNDPKRRAEAVVRINELLRPLSPNIDAEAIADRHLRYLGEPRYLTELAERHHAGADAFPLDGKERLDAARAHGKGVILACAHFGYAAALNYALESNGYDVWEIVARTSRRRSSERKRFKKYSRFREALYRNIRGRPGFETMERQIVADFNARTYLEVLENNGMLLLSADGLNSAGVAHVNFLGRSLPFPTGYAGIALRTGSPVLPVFAVDGDGPLGVRVIVDEPLVVEKTGDRREDVRRPVEQFVRIYERYVIQYPHLFQFWTGDWLAKREAFDKKAEERY
jgi:KDO2-lipid IV(A) lauroyltransferase